MLWRVFDTLEQTVFISDPHFTRVKYLVCDESKLIRWACKAKAPSVCVIRTNPPPNRNLPVDRSGDSDDDDDNEDSFSDDSEQEETKKPPKRQASTHRGKKRAAAGPWSETPAGVRRNGGAGRNGRVDDDVNGDGESNSWESVAGLSLCQFWRYRLLLEVVLAAREGGVQAGGREEHGRAPEPRLAEVREQRRQRDGKEALGLTGGAASRGKRWSARSTLVG